MKVAKNKCYFCKYYIKKCENIRICYRCKTIKNRNKLYLDLVCFMAASPLGIEKPSVKVKSEFKHLLAHIKKGIVTISENEMKFMMERIEDKKLSNEKFTKDDVFFLSRNKTKKKKKKESMLKKEWDIHSINIFGNWLHDNGINITNSRLYSKILGGNFSKVLSKEYSEDKKIKFPEMIKRNHNREKLRRVGIKIEEHENLIWQVIHKKFNFYLDDEGIKEQAFSAGIEGLLAASGTFNPKKAKWSTYAWGWIEGKIKRHFQNNDPDSLIRIPCNKQTKDRKEGNDRLKTMSLDKKMNESEENGETLSCFVGNGDPLPRELFLNELEGHLSNLFEKKYVTSFFSYVFHGKKWNLEEEKLKEMLDEVKFSFVEDGKLF